jgi:RNA polymerase sigma-70 factor (ECF subfamily)
MDGTRDFEGFYATNFRALTTQLYAYCGDMANAQEAVQEACCRALARWQTLSTYEDPAGWVRRVAWNLATSQWRQTRRISAWTPDEKVSAAGPTPDRVDLVSALGKLPADQRQAMVLHYVGDLSVNEIAEMLDVPTGTVKSWMSRARAFLLAELSEKDTITPVGSGGRTATQDRESFSGPHAWPGPTTEGPGITVTDPLVDVFAQWLAESAANSAEPALSALYRMVGERGPDSGE